MRVPVTLILRTFLIASCWCFAIRQVRIDYDHGSGLFPGMISTLLIVLASAVSFISVFIDRRQYKKLRSFGSFLPTAVSIGAITTALLVNEALRRQDRTPTVLYAVNSETVLSSSRSLDFRKDGTYKCGSSGSFLGGYNFKRGHYVMKDSLIFLDRAGAYDFIVSDRWRMMTRVRMESRRKRTLFGRLRRAKPVVDTISETVLFQVDANGDTIPGAQAFTVNGGINIRRQ